LGVTGKKAGGGISQDGGTGSTRVVTIKEYQKEKGIQGGNVSIRSKKTTRWCLRLPIPRN